MRLWRASSGSDRLFLPRPFCAETCQRAPAACEAARHLADDEYVQRTLSRTIASTIDEPTSLSRLWPDLVGVIRARRPVMISEQELLRSFAGHGADWLAERRGAQAGWSYTDTGELRDRVQSVLLSMAGQDSAALNDALARLRATAHRLYRREFEPYPACGIVCAQDPPLCLYRGPVADLVAAGRHRAAWQQADAADAQSEGKTRHSTWEVCQDAAYDLVEFPDDDIPAEARAALDQTARRVCLCFEQQMLAADQLKVPRTSRRILARVLAEGGF